MRSLKKTAMSKVPYETQVKRCDCGKNLFKVF